MSDNKNQSESSGDDSPKFGRLLVVLLLAVVFVGVLTWIMETYFPNFG